MDKNNTELARNIRICTKIGKERNITKRLENLEKIAGSIELVIKLCKKQKYKVINRYVGHKDGHKYK